MVDLPRFRRRQQQNPPRFYDKPSRERHFVSIIGSLLSVVMLVVAMALREWAKAKDDKCEYIFGLTKVYITHFNPPGEPDSEVKNSELFDVISPSVAMLALFVGASNSSCLTPVVKETLVGSLAGTHEFILCGLTPLCTL